jgi:protein-S-isoprenylcysteine O-methyltransferase Ste14
VKIIIWLDVAIAAAFGVFVISRGGTGAHFYFGSALGIAGIALWILARLQLGKSFSVRAEARTLVTRGLYSRIRHPIYFFGGIGYLGFFVAWGKPILALGFLATYVIQFLRIRKEEAVLEQAFGEEYRRYRAGTWF